MQQQTTDVPVRAGDKPTGEFIKEYEKWKPLYSGALKTARTRFEILDDEFSMIQGHDPIHSIQTRLKTVESAYEKLKRRGYEQIPANLAQIKDIAGVRVVCSYLEDIYKIARVFLNQNGVRLLTEKDYIKEPKSNGYRSLHLIVEMPVSLSAIQMGVPVEIQLRTISMNMWASLEHEVSYKVNQELVDSYRAELKACADDLFGVEERMQRLCQKIRKEPNSIIQEENEIFAKENG
ncbi:MAG: GTP pyrophosphokinase family protein [Clostridia bacterium]|nr:GTP pyrophosphokinase family protein [Clostridia bacterium]